MKKIYIAGKYNKEDNFKKDIRYDFTDGRFLNESTDIKINNNLSYVGAYYFNVNNELNFNTTEIVNNDFRLIDSCDIFLAVFDGKPSVGTVAETIYAASKNKKIIIFDIYHETKYDIASSNWFMIRMVQNMCDYANAIIYKNKYDVVNFLNKLKEGDILL